jgi:hypothetical protein
VVALESEIEAEKAEVESKVIQFPIKAVAKKSWIKKIAVAAIVLTTINLSVFGQTKEESKEKLTNEVVTEKMLEYQILLNESRLVLEKVNIEEIEKPIQAIYAKMAPEFKVLSDGLMKGIKAYMESDIGKEESRNYGKMTPELEKKYEDAKAKAYLNEYKEKSQKLTDKYTKLVEDFREKQEKTNPKFIKAKADVEKYEELCNIYNNLWYKSLPKKQQKEYDNYIEKKFKDIIKKMEDENERATQKIELQKRELQKRDK